MTIFYDTHAHLDFPDFAADLPQVVERAHAAGIAKIITIGTDLASSERALELSEKFPGVFAAVGWHPSHASEAPSDVRPALRELARHPKVVAIGETGLDYHRLPSLSGAHGVTRPTSTDETGSVTPRAPSPEDERYKRKQADLFHQQMEIAAEFGFNCIIYQRDAFDDVLAQMQPFQGKLRGVFHCFVNDVAAQQRVQAIGSLVSFTGIVTFKNAQNVRDTLAATPPGQFMLETDCPYLAPMPYRGRRCEPAYVKEISEVVAQVKGCSLEELSRATCGTAQEFFPRLK